MYIRGNSAKRKAASEDTKKLIFLPPLVGAFLCPNIWGPRKACFLGRGGIAGTSAEAELWHRTERTPTRGAPSGFLVRFLLRFFFDF